MARGKAQHQAYLDAMRGLGKDLARRARSRCELSGVSGSLQAYDLSGGDEEPSLEHVVLVCAQVREHLEGRGLKDRDALRYIDEAVWSDVEPVRRAAVMILERIDEPWAREALEHAAMMDGAQAIEE